MLIQAQHGSRDAALNPFCTIHNLIYSGLTGADSIEESYCCVWKIAVIVIAVIVVAVIGAGGHIFLVCQKSGEGQQWGKNGPFSTEHSENDEIISCCASCGMRTVPAQYYVVAIPEFPGWRANSEGGLQPNNLTNFFFLGKLHENEEFFAGGVCPLRAI